MNKLEAIKHEWKPGEPIWSVIHKSTIIPGIKEPVSMPVGIREIFVKSVRTENHYPYVSMSVKFDITDPNIISDDNELILDQFIPGGQEKDEYDWPETCHFKFFTKAEAMKSLIEWQEVFRMKLTKQLNAMKDEGVCIEQNLDKWKKMKFENDQSVMTLNYLLDNLNG